MIVCTNRKGTRVRQLVYVPTPQSEFQYVTSALSNWGRSFSHSLGAKKDHAKTDDLVEYNERFTLTVSDVIYLSIPRMAFCILARKVSITRLIRTCERQTIFIKAEFVYQNR